MTLKQLTSNKIAMLWAIRCAKHAVAQMQLVVMLLVLLLGASAPAYALKPIIVTTEDDRIEITTLGEAYEGRGDSLMVETAAGSDGVVGRMSVKAATSGTNPNWIVFALTNPTDKPIERWLTAERYTVAGSGVVWPDLDARRIEAVTPSIGFVPQRIRSDRADIFALTVEPGQTITYVAELSSERFARIYLWKPLEYEVKARDRQLFNGIMLGLSVLTALFLTVIFAANHKLIFPAAALFAWCVLAYLCVDFGFFHKIFNMKPEDNAVYRAAAESAMAASLVMFLYAFLRLGLSHGLIRMLLLLWILAQLSLVAVAAIDPRLASTFARFSFLAIGGIGGLATLYLALRGQDRAMHILPPWIMFLVWNFLAGVVLTGRLTGDVFVQTLIGGLVLILLLIGFVVTQFAFRSLEPLAGLAPTDNQLRAIAVEGARSAVWEWSSRRDEIKTGTIVEQILGLNPGELSVKVDEFLVHVHPADRERFRLSLWSVQERAGGKIRADFRMRHTDNSYRWFELEAASVETSDRRSVRCVGLMRDVTEMKMSHERLLQDAVFCKLTGMPNRELLLDRLATAMLRAKTELSVRPTVIVVDIDKFKGINSAVGYAVGDSVLLAVARRLQRHVRPNDTIARLGGDQFAILFIEQQDPTELASLAERMRRSLRAPIQISSQEVVLTGSLGIAIYDGEERTPADLLKEAEIAMYRAKRSGSDRIEIFKPEMRGDDNERETMETSLRKALDKNRVKVLYQPIVYLPTEQLAGFEALVRLEHPKLGYINVAPFLPIAETSDLIGKLNSLVLTAAAQDAAVWHKELPRPEDHLFVSVNVPSRQVLKAELAQEVRHLMARFLLAAGTMKIEIAEQLAMENPEHAVEILTQLKAAGADVVIDEFGSGHSSLVYLQRLPSESIKLERSLVRAAGSGDERAVALLKGIVALAHELGRNVIAEGVEKANDVIFLRSIGCEYGQGHYYGEPMLDREVVELLRVIRKSERKLQTHGFFKAKQRRSSKQNQSRVEAQSLDEMPAAATAAASAGQGPGAGAPPPQVGPAVQGNGGGGAGREPAAPRPAPQSAMRVRPRHPQSHGMPGAPAPAPIGATSPPPQRPPQPPQRMLPAGAARDGAQRVGMFGDMPAMQSASSTPANPPPAARQMPATSVPSNGPAGAGVSASASPGGAPARPSPPPQDGGQRQTPPVPASAVASVSPTPPLGASPSVNSSKGGDGRRALPSDPPPVPNFEPDFSTLPPGIAASLAKLAGGLGSEEASAVRPPAAVREKKDMQKT